MSWRLDLRYRKVTMVHRKLNFLKKGCVFACHGSHLTRSYSTTYAFTRISRTKLTAINVYAVKICRLFWRLEIFSTFNPDENKTWSINRIWWKSNRSVNETSRKRKLEQWSIYASFTFCFNFRFLEVSFMLLLLSHYIRRTLWFLFSSGKRQ